MRRTTRAEREATRQRLRRAAATPAQKAAEAARKRKRRADETEEEAAERKEKDAARRKQARRDESRSEATKRNRARREQYKNMSPEKKAKARAASVERARKARVKAKTTDAQAPTAGTGTSYSSSSSSANKMVIIKAEKDLKFHTATVIRILIGFTDIHVANRFARVAFAREAEYYDGAQSVFKSGSLRDDVTCFATMTTTSDEYTDITDIAQNPDGAVVHDARVRATREAHDARAIIEAEIASADQFKRVRAACVAFASAHGMPVVYEDGADAEEVDMGGNEIVLELREVVLDREPVAVVFSGAVFFFKDVFSHYVDGAGDRVPGENNLVFGHNPNFEYWVFRPARLAELLDLVATAGVDVPEKEQQVLDE